jgi:hypothetical protein
MTHENISHNGYVSVAPRNYGCDYNKKNRRINTKCLTFGGDLTGLGLGDKIWFLGFDTFHGRNDERPESRTYAAVKKRTMALADEMVEKGI